MKALQGLLLSFSLLITANTFACGGSSYSDDNGCMNNGGCPDSYCSECQCTDYDCKHGTNSCLDKATCCDAFGNVGGR